MNIDYESTSIFKPIIVKFNIYTKSLIFKVRKKKGDPLLDKFKDDTELTKNAPEILKQAKNLPPIADFDKPYWQIYYITRPFLSRRDNDQKLQYRTDYTQYVLSNTIAEKIENSVSAYNNISSLLPFQSHDFFTRFTDNKKSLRSVFFLNTLVTSSLEEYLTYRETNSHLSYLDETQAYELSSMMSDEHHPTSPEIRNQLLYVFSKLRYHVIKENICSWKVMEELLASHGHVYMMAEVDLIVIDFIMFSFANRKYASYSNSYLIFTFIILAVHALKKGGIFKFVISELNNQLIKDILGVMSHFFEDVYIFKSSTQPVISPYKYIIGNKFKGISNEKIQELIDIHTKWAGSCNPNLTSFQKDKMYVHSILDNNFENVNEYIEKFNTIETIRKINAWTNIINAYNSIKICGSSVINVFNEQQISNTLYYFEQNNIPIDFSHKKLDNDLRKNTLQLDFTNTMLQYTFSDKHEKVLDPIFTGRDMKKPYDLPELYTLDNNLKTTKRILDPLTLNNRDKYTKISDMTSKLQLLKKELSKYTKKRVSQAFIKFYEILSTFDLFDKKAETLKSFHFCEAPGQFILATEHFIETKTDITNFDWIAQSYNPKVNKAYFGDNYGLMRKYPERWDFGVDNTGDILSRSNINYYALEIEGPKLVTSDCGMDMKPPTDSVYQDKGYQELNLAQITLALKVLPIGGNYVSKVFLPQSLSIVVALNYILYCSFKKFHIYKPMINAGSSEVYLVCQHFLGLTKKQLKSLSNLQNIFHDNTTIVSYIPQSFLNQYNEAMSIFLQRTIKHIQQNIFYYENPSVLQDIQKIDEIYQHNVQDWINYFKFEAIL